MIKNILFYGSFFFIGLFFIDTVLELASHPHDFLIAVGMFLGFVYLYRDNKESLFLTFKDTHQSNLEDIEEHQLEENTESISVRKEIQISLKKIFKNAIGLGIAASILWVVGLAFGIFEFNDGSFKYLILSVPGLLIVAYLIVKSFSVVKDMFQDSKLMKKSTS